MSDASEFECDKKCRAPAAGPKIQRMAASLEEEQITQSTDWIKLERWGCTPFLLFVILYRKLRTKQKPRGELLPMKSRGKSDKKF